jgi:hypothetical protein
MLPKIYIDGRPNPFFSASSKNALLLRIPHQKIHELAEVVRASYKVHP